MRDYEKQAADLRICAESDDPVDECCWEECTAHQGDRSPMCRQKIMLDAADAIEELLAFARSVARRAVDAQDDEVSAEVLCRKLYKLGIIEKDGAWWALPEPPKGGAHD